MGGSGPPLSFRASVVSPAEYAVADFSDEDKSSPSKAGDDGLLISKLGISQDIVTALATKGITKLFPIQVLTQHITIYLFIHSSLFLV